MDEIKIIRQWFKDYHKWKIKAARLKPRQRAIQITGLPKSKPTDPDSKMIQYTNATNECQQRLDLWLAQKKTANYMLTLSKSGIYEGGQLLKQWAI